MIPLRKIGIGQLRSYTTSLKDQIYARVKEYIISYDACGKCAGIASSG